MKKILLIIVSAIFIISCSTTPVRKQFNLDGDHGKLSVILQTPANKKVYPIVMILHGFNASKDMALLVQLADILQQRGIASVRFDFNGHGQSEGAFLDMTPLNEIEDTKKVYEYVSKLPQVTSISLVGHSLGGVISAMFAGQEGKDKIKSFVLMAPAGELKDDTLKGDLFGTKYDSKNIPEYIFVAGGKLKVGRAFLQASQTLPIYEMAAEIVHSKDDGLVPYAYGLKYKEIYKNGELKTLSGLNHNFDGNIQNVDNIVADFFEKHLLME